MTKITIIIPVLNEENNITKILKNLQNDQDTEVIVVDGGSQDITVQLVEEMGIKIVVSPQAGRAFQMNYGALLATGDILLFLHADTILPQEYKTIITNLLSDKKVVGGAFELKIDLPQFSLRIIETLVNWRSRFFSLPYGDQAIFVKKSIFEGMGGFSALPIMEDFEFMQRLKKYGKIAIASAKVITSGRRWQKLGVLQTTLINQKIILGYYLGVSPDTLVRWYKGK
ncbi:glycosyl transferase family 2 [Rippkaea orientalis PCC 8801]|uniref:4,4'-diaponeurosporenoate glycosyltransferase n=1 Tax=Rippkaea orientalis (strain PCC 8801 / RF-1) TaxID=41431 RepID=B7K2Z6_RIPO1|nr:TIGR04283 family arsenosugar biosynthesis glycosyltransferase [Rippkaea orientalis]ACK67697.1 glycosyl transferase family 2 [Rippkaea orientalis PCC 8801]